MALSEQPSYNRRVTDKPEIIERVVRLETNIDFVKTSVDTMSSDLKEHILEERDLIRSISVGIQKVADATETNKSTMERMSESIDTIASQEMRVNSLEEFRERAEGFMSITHEKLDNTTVKVDRIYWIVGVLSTIAAGLWSVFTFFVNK